MKSHNVLKIYFLSQKVSVCTTKTNWCRHVFTGLQQRSQLLFVDNVEAMTFFCARGLYIVRPWKPLHVRSTYFMLCTVTVCGYTSCIFWKLVIYFFCQLFSHIQAFTYHSVLNVPFCAFKSLFCNPNLNFFFMPAAETGNLKKIYIEISSGAEHLFHLNL